MCLYLLSISVVNILAHDNVSALGAVMAFLYSSYIILNAVLSTVLGKVIDKDFTKNKSIIYSLKTVGGCVSSCPLPLSNNNEYAFVSVHFSVACVIIFASTFIPKGAFAFNPKVIGTEPEARPSSESQRSDGDESDFKKGGAEREVQGMRTQ